MAGPASIGRIEGTGSAARFYGPRNVALDNNGNLYVADTANHTIRKITSAGLVSTLAGKPGIAASADGAGAAARFDSPSAEVVDNAGNLSVADRYNDNITKISPTGVITTLAGNGRDTSLHQFNIPIQVCLNAAGNLDVACFYDSASGQISPAGLVSRLNQPAYASYTHGPPSNLPFYPAGYIAITGGIAIDKAGNF